MTPIHDLLSRIRWDADFSKAQFEIGYWDRVAGRVQRIDLRELAWDADNPSMFDVVDVVDVVDEDGVCHSIPFHRVREVWRDGVLIWHRELPGE